jgi:hypothetical protein
VAFRLVESHRRRTTGPGALEGRRHGDRLGGVEPVDAADPVLCPDRTTKRKVKVKFRFKVRAIDAAGNVNPSVPELP